MGATLTHKRGTVFFNPSSGPSETSADDLAAVFPGASVHEIDSDFDTQLRKHLSHASPDFVAVAGGDGTIRSAAAILIEDKGPPLVPVPAGTRNHFARALDMPELEDAGRAGQAGSVTRIDVGRVNGQWFVNNSSLGVYPEAVALREEHERRIPKRLAQWLAAWQLLRGGEPFAAKVGSLDLKAWLIFVGNGAYGDDLRDIIRRDSLTRNELDVRIVRADRRLGRLRLLAAILTGRLRHTRVIELMSCSAVEIDVDRSRVKVALDGEVKDLTAPLHFESVPGALAVKVPPGEGHAAR